MTGIDRARIAVLASGQGTNFVALAKAANENRLGGELVLLITDREDAPVLERAAELGVPGVYHPPGPYRTRLGEGEEEKLVSRLRESRIDLVLLAGFMRVVHAPFLRAFAGRILNVHPSLLPSFPGLAAAKQALEYGVAFTGCTIHLVDDVIDGGIILGQAVVPIKDGDTVDQLVERINQAEHQLYPETVRRFLTEPHRTEGRRIVWGAS